MELDHFFVVARDLRHGQRSDVADSTVLAAEWVSALQRHGFCEGTANHHPGQGTSNHRFFFDGFMLEFLYVDDVPALNDVRGAQLGLPDRFTNADCSPFGVCTRRSQLSEVDACYSSTVYQPLYLPEPLHIQVASQVVSTEPLVFHLPFVAGSGELNASDTVQGSTIGAVEVDHPNGVSRLTSLSIEMPFAPSAAMKRIARYLSIDVIESDRHYAHLVFDRGTDGALPLPATMNISITL